MSILGQRLTRTFVELADTVVPGFDLAGFLRLLSVRCVDVLGVSAAGVCCSRIVMAS
jgi:hypothetical protein